MHPNEGNQSQQILNHPFWKENSPSRRSCKSFYVVLQKMAMQAQWAQVANFASQAILHLNQNCDRLDFYHLWICALSELDRREDLLSLANHLQKMNHEFSVYYSLASLAYLFAGEKKNCKILLQKQWESKNINNHFFKEVKGLFLLASSKKEKRLKGLNTLVKNCFSEKINYIQLRNALKFMSKFSYENAMARIYNLMHEKFPEAHEPYIASALIAIQQKDWNESIRILRQVVTDSPGNTEAILALTHSFHNAKNIEMALLLLEEKKHHFHDLDYDFHLLSAEVKDSAARCSNNKNFCENAIEHYDAAISIAKFLKFPFEKMYLAKKRLEIFSRNLRDSAYNSKNIYSQYQNQNDLISQKFKKVV